MPRIRIGRRWINVLWFFPLAFLILILILGAPVRLRCENELGFKMVKWIEAIEFVSDFHHLGAGNGGYNEDHEFYGYRMPI